MFFELTEPLAKIRNRTSSYLGAVDGRMRNLSVWHEGIFLLSVLAVFGVRVAYPALVAPLWFDEFFTLFISRLPSLQEIVKAMPADGQPPMQYLLTHISLAVASRLEIAMRLPEILAYLLTGALTYRIVRQHGTAIQAMFAMTMIMGADLILVQAISARPYELLIAFTALTFASWQMAVGRERRRLLPLCGVAAGVAGAILSHHFAVFHVGSFLVAGEAVRTVQRRRIDGLMCAAVLTGLLPLIITMPLAYEFHRLIGKAIFNAPNFWAKPSLADLGLYREMINQPLLFLTATLATLLVTMRSETTVRHDVIRVPACEWAAVGALCLLLTVILLFSAFGTGYFSRYAISTSLGLVVLGAWGLPRLNLLRKMGQSVLALSTFTYLLAMVFLLIFLEFVSPVWRASVARDAVSPLLMCASGELPIVVANAEDFAKEWWYSPPIVQHRLVYLADLHYAVQQRGFVGELALVTDRESFPLPISDYAAFVESHPQFLILSTGRQDFIWLPKRLQSAGWHLQTLARRGDDVLYRAGQK